MVVVMAPFSLMPHADTIVVPSIGCARSTSGPGIGAPAHKNVVRLGTPVPAVATVSVRSARNGVDAMVKVEP